MRPFALYILQKKKKKNIEVFFVGLGNWCCSLLVGAFERCSYTIVESTAGVGIVEAPYLTDRNPLTYAQ